MKVLLLNGSPHEKGCTHAALQVVAEELERKAFLARFSGLGMAPCRIA